MRIMVSACLLGQKCKYNGGDNYSEKVLNYTEGHEVIPVCPEVAGGLSVPRLPCEIVNGVVTDNKGTSRDKEFRKGAELCLNTAKEKNADLVILQSRSPSCGVKQIYDGSFSGKLIEGSGVFASLLKENDFRIMDVEDIPETFLSGTLDIKPGITAVIGSGGKTTLIRKLADEISGRFPFNCQAPGNPDCDENNGKTTNTIKTVICTTTHILRPADMPVFEVSMEELEISETEDHPELEDSKSTCVEKRLAGFFRKYPGKPVCVGVTDPHNSEKLISFPTKIIMKATGENAYILVEADGAKHMPLKAHNDNEPVIPEGCKRVILVIGAEGFGRPIMEVVHRPEIFAELADTDVNEIVTPKLLSKVLLAEKSKFGNCRLQLLVNRTHIETTETDIETAQELAKLTGWEVFMGNVHKGEIIGSEG